MKKVIVIGANSYIARNLIYILKEQHDCTLGLYDLQERHLDGESNYEQISFYNQATIKNINFLCDTIFIFVGKTGSTDGFINYDNFIDANEKALLAILNEYVRQDSKAKIIFPSTRLVYKGAKGVLPEDANKEFKTIYAMNKYACEQYLKMFYHVYNVKYCIFRICVPYGTLIQGASSYGTAEFMLNKAIKGEDITLYGDGSQRRTLTYIKDLCEILIWGAASERCQNDVYNIGGEDYSLKEMAELIANKYKVGILYVEWPKIAKKIESGDTVFDSRKIDYLMEQNAIIYNKKFEKWINT